MFCTFYDISLITFHEGEINMGEDCEWSDKNDVNLSQNPVSRCMRIGSNDQFAHVETNKPEMSTQRGLFPLHPSGN